MGDNDQVPTERTMFDEIDDYEVSPGTPIDGKPTMGRMPIPLKMGGTPIARGSAFSTSPDISELAAALAAAQGDMQEMPKSGENRYDHYRYPTLSDHTATVRRPLATHGLSLLVTQSGHLDLGSRESGEGKTMWRARVWMVGRLMHSSGQWIEVLATGDGEDRGEKATAKACTSARKALLANLLNLAAADEDADAVQTAAPGPTQRRQKPPAVPPSNAGTPQTDPTGPTNLPAAESPEQRRARIVVKNFRAKIASASGTEALSRVSAELENQRQFIAEADYSALIDALAAKA